MDRANPRRAAYFDQLQRYFLSEYDVRAVRTLPAFAPGICTLISSRLNAVAGDQIDRACRSVAGLQRELLIARVLEIARKFEAQQQDSPVLPAGRINRAVNRPSQWPLLSRTANSTNSGCAPWNALPGPNTQSPVYRTSGSGVIDGATLIGASSRRHHWRVSRGSKSTTRVSERPAIHARLRTACDSNRPTARFPAQRCPPTFSDRLRTHDSQRRPWCARPPPAPERYRLRWQPFAAQPRLRKSRRAHDSRAPAGCEPAGSRDRDRWRRYRSRGARKPTAKKRTRPRPDQSWDPVSPEPRKADASFCSLSRAPASRNALRSAPNFAA